jgi:tRNA-Thr(GGU) m(6)t(6)A37 methyltransferase TsaA
MTASTKKAEPRPGERALPFDPAATADDARIVFIGRIRSPWTDRRDCPHNLREARERGGGGTVEIDEAWRAGLDGLAEHAGAVLLYWLGEARRDLIVQAPAHRPRPTGTFALRSPVRPNPIGIGAVRILSVDQAAGRIAIDAIDCLDGTPLIDVKPWIATVDAPPVLASG